MTTTRGTRRRTAYARRAPLRAGGIALAAALVLLVAPPGAAVRALPLAPVEGPVTSGLVVDGDGAPVSGAAIARVPLPVPRPADPFRDPWRDAVPPPAPLTRSGGDGTFPLARADGEGHLLVATAPGFLEGAALLVGSGPVRIVLGAPRRLEGRVQDAGTEAGVDGARVTLTAPPRNGRSVAVAAESAPGGGFVLEGLPPEGPWTLTAFPPAGAPLRAAQVRGLAPGTRDLRIALGAGGSLAGLAVDHTGAPLAGVTVYLHVPASGEPDFARRALTDGNGRFLAPALGPGPWTCSLVPSPLLDGSPAPGTEFFSADPRHGCVPGPRPVVLAGVPAAVLAGRVTLPDGSPARGDGNLRVRSLSSAAFRRVPVAADGTFRVEGLDPRATWELVADSFDGGRGTLMRPLTAPATGLEVRVGDWTTLAGRVVLPDGSPAPAGIEVRARAVTAERTHPGREGTATTGPDGTFTLRGLGPFEFQVTAGDARGTWCPLDGEVRARPGDGPVLRVEHRPGLRLRLVDGEGRWVAATAATVTVPGQRHTRRCTLREGVLDAGGTPGAYAEIRLGDGNRRILVAVLALPCEGGDLVLPPSVLEALAHGGPAAAERHAGRQAAALGLPLPEGVRVVEDDLVYPGRLRGRVGDQRGSPVAGAEVRVRPATAEAAAVVVHTDAEGRFETPVLAAERHSVEVSAEGFGPVPPRHALPGAGELEFELRAGLVIGGVVLDDGDGSPVARFPVVLSVPLPEPAALPDLPPGTGGPWRGLREGRYLLGGSTDGEGRFLLGPVAPGTYTVVAGTELPRRGEVRDDLMDAVVAGVAAGTRDLVVRVPRGAAIEGVVRGADGAPLPEDVRARVVVTLGPPGGFPRRQGSSVDAEGRFRVGSLPEGEYEIAAVCSVNPSCPMEDRRVVAVRKGMPPLALRIPLGPGISGRVVDAHGGPVAGARVEVLREGDDGYARATAVTDGEGRFRTPPLDADGTYVAGWEPGPALPPSLATGLRCGAADVLLRPSPGWAVAGIVTDLAGAPVPGGIPVTAVETGAGPGRFRFATRGVVTAEDGRFRIEGLTAGRTYRLLAGGGSSGYLWASDGPVVEAATEAAVLRLRPAARIEGTLVGEDGAPVPLAMILARWEGDPGDPVTAAGGSTDAEGRFLLSTVRPGPVRVLLARGRLEIPLAEVEAPAADLRLVVPRE